MSDFSAAIGGAGSQKGQRTALGVEALAQSFLDNLFFVQGRSLERSTTFTWRWRTRCATAWWSAGFQP